MGLVHVYCGDGKGKTSAATGLAVRAAGQGITVVVVRFLKTDASGEVSVLNKIPQITVLPCEKTFGFVSSMDEATREAAAAYQREQFEKAVSLAARSGAGLLILDEIMAAMKYGMIPESVVLEFLKNRPDSLEVVLTGRDPSCAILEAADYISEIKKIRHPYNRGISARKGIEY